MMSEETRTWVRRIFSAAVKMAAGTLKDEGEESAGVILEKLAPGLVEQLLDEVINEDVELQLGPDATATGDVVFRD